MALVKMKGRRVGVALEEEGGEGLADAGGVDDDVGRLPEVDEGGEAGEEVGVLDTCPLVAGDNFVGGFGDEGVVEGGEVDLEDGEGGGVAGGVLEQVGGSNAGLQGGVAGGFVFTGDVDGDGVEGGGESSPRRRGGRCRGGRGRGGRIVGDGSLA